MTAHSLISSALSSWHAAILYAPSLVFAVAALAGGGRWLPASAWRCAIRSAAVAMLLASLSFALVLLGAQGTGWGVRADLVGAVLMLLVTFVGWIIVRYSQSCMRREPGEGRYLRALMFTLAAVTTVIATNNLGVLTLAWMATGLAVDRLLVFFGDRPLAIVTAHKKRIVARVADVCMASATALLLMAFDTLQVDEIVRRAAEAPALPSTATAATLLICSAALLRCAQLPFHGWLIQVMEAPTPVSALLHAGIVNLGGFVLMRLAPLIAQSPASQVLLVVAGTVTAVLAGLVMSTRISVKVALAWSTCAQMGFLVLQCGLGAWGLALLHLVAHSLYKAHAFLSAGGAVRNAAVADLGAPAAVPTAPGLALGLLASLAMALVAGVAIASLVPGHPMPLGELVLAGVVVLSWVPLVAPRPSSVSLPRARRLAAIALGAVGVAFVSLSLHALAGGWFASDLPAPSPGVSVGVALAFAAMFAVQSVIAVAPEGRVARALYPRFFGGLYLDEKFTRCAFAVWPAPHATVTASLLPVPEITIDMRAQALKGQPWTR